MEKVGVLALQGAVREHCSALRACGVEPVEVKYKEQLVNPDGSWGIRGLVIPGGESTTVGKLLVRYGILEVLREMGKTGFPIFGTCTGLILLARDIDGSEQPRIGLMDITVKRNAFGRQIASFEANLPISELGTPDFPAVFIRAPYITSVGPEVKVLAKEGDRIYFAQQDKLLVAAFHPELTSDLRIHRYFISLCGL